MENHSNPSSIITPQIYFHVGMGKVASTYLREEFLPKLEGAYFISRRDRFRAVKIIQESNHEKYILCRALDTQMESGIRDMAEHFPNTYPIIVLRKADSWIMSQYRRWVKNGFPGSLPSFVDVAKNEGYWPREELLFMPKIRMLEKHFNQRPLVLFYEELKNDPQKFFDRFAAHTGCSYDFSAIQLSRTHISHDERGLIFRRKIRRLFSDSMPRYTQIPVLHWIQRRWLMIFAYAVVWIAKQLPLSMLQKESFVHQSDLDDIRDFTANDWGQVQAYASEKASDVTDYNP